MLEEAFPALWSAVHGFFTPAVLFVVLNIVIGTIAVTTKVASAAAAGDGEGAAAPGGGEEQQQQNRRLSRVPSMAFERLRSFNLNSFAAPPPETAVSGEVDLGYEQPPTPPAVEKEVPAVVVEREVEPEPEVVTEHEREHAHAAAHVERSRSEAAAVAEVPRLPARLHKSASDRSAFAHFEAEEVEEAVRAVEARRPATTREGGARRLRVPVAEPDSSDSEQEEEEAEAEEAAGGHGGGGVDAMADAFINKFHHQLKLQRIESFIRHRETVRRGQAAAAAGVF